MRLSNFPPGKFDTIPYSVRPEYTNPESRAKTVTIMGASRTKDGILKDMELCSNVTKALVQRGYNVLSGCGANGIMGAAYNAAKLYSAKDPQGKPKQNLGIVVEPPWGDEDLEHIVSIGKATSESDRIGKFAQASDNFIVFPGGATSMMELTSEIQNKENQKNPSSKKIICAGEHVFGIVEQLYKKLFEIGTLKRPPQDLFKVAKSEEEILKEFPKIK